MEGKTIAITLAGAALLAVAPLARAQSVTRDIFIVPDVSGAVTKINPTASDNFPKTPRMIEEERGKIGVMVGSALDLVGDLVAGQFDAKTHPDWKPYDEHIVEPLRAIIDGTADARPLSGVTRRAVIVPFGELDHAFPAKKSVPFSNFPAEFRSFLRAKFPIKYHDEAAYLTYGRARTAEVAEEMRISRYYFFMITSQAKDLAVRYEGDAQRTAQRWVSDRIVRSKSRIGLFAYAGRPQRDFFIDVWQVELKLRERFHLELLQPHGDEVLPLGSSEISWGLHSLTGHHDSHGRKPQGLIFTVAIEDPLTGEQLHAETMAGAYATTVHFQKPGSYGLTVQAEAAEDAPFDVPEVTDPLRAVLMVSEKPVRRIRLAQPEPDTHGGVNLEGGDLEFSWAVDVDGELVKPEGVSFDVRIQPSGHDDEAITKRVEGYAATLTVPAGTSGEIHIIPADGAKTEELGIGAYRSYYYSGAEHAHLGSEHEEEEEMPGHPHDEEFVLLIKGTLPTEQAKSLRAHLEICEGCRGRVDRLSHEGLGGHDAHDDDHDDDHAKPAHPGDEEFISYLKGVLPNERAKATRAHLEICEGCRGRLESLSGTTGLSVRAEIDPSSVMPAPAPTSGAAPPAPGHPEDQEFLSYLKGSLPEAQAESLRTHLDICEDCRGRLDSLSRSSGLKARVDASNGQAPAPPVPGPAPGHPGDEEFLSYLKGSLPDDQAKSLRGHLDICEDCRGRLDTLKSTSGLSARVDAGAPVDSIGKPGSESKPAGKTPPATTKGEKAEGGPGTPASTAPATGGGAAAALAFTEPAPGAVFKKGETIEFIWNAPAGGGDPLYRLVIAGPETRGVSAKSTRFSASFDEGGSYAATVSLEGSSAEAATVEFAIEEESSPWGLVLIIAALVAFVLFVLHRMGIFTPSGAGGDGEDGGESGGNGGKVAKAVPDD